MVKLIGERLEPASPSAPSAGLARQMSDELFNFRSSALAHSEASRVAAANLKTEVAALWYASQNADYSRVAPRFVATLQAARAAVDNAPGHTERDQAQRLLALTYQAAENVLPKLGDTHHALIVAERGLAAARESGDELVILSLKRAVVHSLVSQGRPDLAIPIVEDHLSHLPRIMDRHQRIAASLHGTLMLAGSMAAARNNDRATSNRFLAEAHGAAARIRADRNDMWTAFGPTNVAIHRVAIAAELGDRLVAADLGPRIVTRTLPIERQVRHFLETARALTQIGKLDDAIALVVQAHQLAPTHVQHHYLSRRLVQQWLVATKRRPPVALRLLMAELGTPFERYGG